MKIRITTRYYVLLFLLFNSCSQETIDQNGIAFLPTIPKIDGILEESLKELTVQDFNLFTRFNNPVMDSVPVSFRMAYSPTHLYLFIEAQTDRIIMRRRGFIAGDGFKFFLAKPQSDSLTNEYYDLIFSASDDRDYWARKRILNYNWSQNFNQQLTEATQFEHTVSDGIAGFELAIAWEDIPPYHPWFMPDMGYNLYFAKAIEDTITNGYSMVYDEGITDEEIEKRPFKPLLFNLPTTSEVASLLFQIQNKHLPTGEALKIKVAAIGQASGTQTLDLAISNEEDEIIEIQKLNINTGAELVQKILQVVPNNLAPGRYQLNIRRNNENLFTDNFTIIPSIDFEAIKTKIAGNKARVSEGTLNTLQFKLLQIEETLAEIHPYETGELILSLWSKFEEEYQSFQNGQDPYESITTPYRRAFQSKYDESYQPYTINLPDNYDPTASYPLLVFLHGSGRDERGLLDAARSGGNFIELAPYGRDKFRAYASEASQKDIVEAIEDVIKYFAVDKSKIIIGGFSMGGYGALRTYYENPDLYKGVVVHAGHPNLANEWLDGEYPNFLVDRYLDVFKNKPVFIYHGQKDGGLPVGLIEEMGEKMKAKGAAVSQYIVAEKGHEYPDESTNQAYFSWLNKVAN